MSSKSEKPEGLNLTRPDQPRWTASPRLRDLGFKPSLPLKRPNGDYMTRGEAWDAVEAINGMVADFKAGISIATNRWSFLAPAQTALAPVASTRSIGALIDLFVGVPADGVNGEPDPKDASQWTQRPADEFRDLERESRRQYRSRLKRLVEALADQVNGHPGTHALPPSAKLEAIDRYERAIAATRALDISELLTDDQPLKTVYRDLRDQINPDTGKQQIRNANSVMANTQSWLSWVMDQKVNGRAIIPFNPALAVKRAENPGRKNVWPEYIRKLFDSQAVAMGWVSIMYMRRMASELSWNQQDIIALTYGQFVAGTSYDENGLPYDVVRVVGGRKKTQVETSTTLTDDGLALFHQVKADWHRKFGDNVEPSSLTPLFVVDAIPDQRDGGAVGKPWNSAYFQHKVIEIKAACNPPIKGYTFQDLRDSAFTEMKEAGMDNHQIQSRTQHASTESVAQLDAKHYGVTTWEISDQAARSLNKLRRMKALRK